MLKYIDMLAFQFHVKSDSMPNMLQGPKPPCPMQYLGRFLGVIGQNTNFSKSNQLHVMIFQVFFIDLIYILWIPLK